jgi:hypothetical protein
MEAPGKDKRSIFRDRCCVHAENCEVHRTPHDGSFAYCSCRVGSGAKRHLLENRLQKKER